jgi:uncharacterized protein YndB with AHSA1/START domain
MRFTDGPYVEVETRIEAPPARVWDFVCDVAVPAEFSSEFQGAEWLDGANPVAVGAKFRGHNKREAFEWHTTSTIVECHEPRSFAWAVEDPDNPAATWRFALEADGAGTILTYSARLGPGPSGLTAAIDQRPDKEERIIENRCEELRRNMTATIEGIKKLAEEE